MSVIQIALALLPRQMGDKILLCHLLLNERGLLGFFRQLRDQLVLRITLNRLWFCVDHSHWKDLLPDSSYGNLMNKGLELLFSCSALNLKGI